jgi:hypothetical protein
MFIINVNQERFKLSAEVFGKQGSKMRDMLKLKTLHHNDTINFAAEELNKYLIQMARSEQQLENVDIELGLFEDFELSSINECKHSMDDEVYIEIKNGKGSIAGINPRSVLLAVYRFLTEAGCRWIRPGVYGEIIPTIEISKIEVKLHERPSYRHRGICIEGAVSLENVQEMIEWLPKVGLNSYFIQFREAYAFFERWYHHTYNDTMEKQTFDIETAREYTKLVEAEISKRGLIYHAVGHGWTCEPFGIPGLSWIPLKETQYSSEITQYFALVNGKREMVDNIPLNLNLCYSNPKVQELMVQDVLNYLKINKNIDVLHFWLADGKNNQCECEECLKLTPTDCYIQILNKLDRVLTENNIDTKIVFLLYFDLLWTPEKCHIENPDRFIMMFAPITRTYSSSFIDAEVSDTIEPYERNNLRMPETVGDNLALLKNWKKEFQGDSFDFDYHMMWDHYYDLGNIATAKTIHDDIVNLKRIKLEGLISCQCQRAFFPTGLAAYTMAKTLWDDRTDFHQLTQEYFEDAFGKNSSKCLELMNALSELFTPAFFRGEISEPYTELTKKYDKVNEVCEQYEILIHENINIGNPTQKKSWEYLVHHREITLIMAKMMKYRTRKDMKMVRQTWEELLNYIRAKEEEIQPIFDLYELVETFEAMNGYTLRGTV